MPSLKIIKRRIASVKSTEHIIKAMDLVAASKLQKARERLDAVRPLYKNSKRIIDDIMNTGVIEENIFIKKREVKSTAYVVITSDRGLCGGYNANIAKKAVAAMDRGKNEKILAVGGKGVEFLRRQGKNILSRYNGTSESTSYEDAQNLGNKLISMYMSGEIDEAYVAYTKFESTMSHIPEIVRLLPIDTGGGTVEPGSVKMEYEAGLSAFLDGAAPMYLSTFLYGAMLESLVCEQAARMMSMDAATNNANEIIDDLTLKFNRVRQNLITQELNEIVSGANALQ